MSMKEMNHKGSNNASITKRNKIKKSHNDKDVTNTNEEFASEIGVEDNSNEGQPVSERSAWN